MVDLINPMPISKEGVEMDINKHIIKPLKTEKALVSASIFVGIVAAILNLSRPIVLGLIISKLTNKDSDILGLVILFILSWCLTWMMSILIRYLSMTVSQHILKNLRTKLLFHFLNIPLDKSELLPLGKIQAYSSSDLPLWAQLYGTILAQIVHAFAQLIGAIIALSNLSIELSIIIIPFLIISGLIPVLSAKKLFVISKGAQDAASGVLETLSGLALGVRDLKGMRSSKWAVSKFEEKSKVSSRAEVRRSITQAVLQICGTATEVFAYTLVLLVGGQRVLKGDLNIGVLVSFLATIEMIFFPVRNANDLFGALQNSLAAANRVIDFFSTEVKDDELTPLFKGAYLHHVTYRYPETDKNILININLKIEPGSLIVIIGESGSGKSSLLKILSGLYEPTEGKLTGVGAVVKKPSLVWQDPVLFNVSVKENLTLGEVASDSLLKETIMKVNLTKQIESYKEKYEHNLQDNGNNLSGGQKKRFAIARMLMNQSDLVLLDEPTSGLDSANSKLIWSLIDEMHNEGKTVIVSTHKLEEISSAAEVIVMHEGEIRLLSNQK